MFSRKKIMAFVLLLNVASPLIFFSGYLAKQKLLEHKMEEKLERASLHTITANLSGIRWVKENREIAVEGKLFDVKSFYTLGDSIILTGLFDYEEQDLEKEFDGILYGENGLSSPFQQFVLKFIFTALFGKNQPASIPSFCENIQMDFLLFIEVVVDQPSSVNTPPPNV